VIAEPHSGAPTAVVAATLDRVQVGIIITSNNVRPAFVNRFAEEVLEQRDGLSVTDAGLETTKASDTHVLRGAIAKALKGELLSCVTLLLPRHKQPRPLVVHVPPRQHGAAAHVPVFVCDTGHARTIDHGSVSRLYGFTRAEVTLVGLLLEGKSLQEAAAELFISVNTARTHLKRALLKTDTSRQAELLRLLLTSSGLVRLDD
jgi:DNA-binding CsgD family transcriptional regulator